MHPLCFRLFLVLQVFSWVDARLFRTQPRSTSTSKTPDSIQVDHLFRKVETSVFSLFANQIPILLFKYEYEKNQWYELPATMMPEGPLPGRCSTNQALSKPSNTGQDCGIHSSQQTYRSAKVRGFYLVSFPNNQKVQILRREPLGVESSTIKKIETSYHLSLFLGQPVWTKFASDRVP